MRVLDELSRLLQAVDDALEARNDEDLARSSEWLDDFASQERPPWEEAGAASSFAKTGLDIAKGRAPKEPSRPPEHNTYSVVVDVPIGKFERLVTALSAAEIIIADIEVLRADQSDARMMRTRLWFDEQADVAPVLEALGWQIRPE